jgi:hypothetical protein
MRYSLAFAALAATTAFAAPAAAQTFTTDSQASIQARALLIQPATIQRDRDLSFGSIVATPAASGTVTIDPNSGLRAIAGAGLTAGTDVGSNGRFLGNGMPQQVVNLRITFPTTLVNVQDNSQAVAFSGTLDTASTGLTRTIGLTGVFYVGVGGQIAIAANQMPGQYSGTVTLDADFQ